MRKMWALTRVLLKSGAAQGYGMTVGASTRKKNPVMTAVLYIVLLVCLIPYFTMAFTSGLNITKALHPLGQDQVVLEFIFLAGSLMTLVFGISFILSIFYLSTDIQTLLPLPLRSEEIVLGKLIVTWLYEVFTSGLLLLPILIGHGIGARWSVLQWLLGALTFFFLPLMPLAVAGIFSMFVMFLLRGRASRGMVMGISTIFLLAVVMLFSSAGGYMGSMSEMTGDNAIAEMLQNLAGSVIGKYGKLIPLLGPMTKAVSQPSLLWLLVVIAGNLVCVGVFCLAARVLYLPGVLSMKESGGRSRAMTAAQQDKMLRRSSPFGACLAKEWRTLMRSPVFFMNTAMIGLIWPVFFLLPLIFSALTGDGESLFSLLGRAMYFLSEPEAAPIVVLIVFGVTVFGAGLCMVAGTAMSREGRSYTFMKCIPVSYRTQLSAKLAVGVGISAFSTAGYGLIAMIYLVIRGLSPATIPIALLLSLAMNVLVGCVNLFLDLAFPKLNWENEMVAVKQHFIPIIGMLISFVVGGLLCAAYGILVIGVGMNYIVVGLVLGLVLAALAVGAYFLLMAFGQKRLSQLED